MSPANVDLDEKNPPRSEAASASELLDWSAPDRIDDKVINQIRWRALRGSDSPPPVRSVFLRPITVR